MRNVVQAILASLKVFTTLGHSAGGSSTCPNTGDRCWATQFTATASGKMVSISPKFDSSSAAGASFKAVIFSDSAGAPNTLLGSSAAVVIPAGGGVLLGTLTVPVTIVNGTSYWLGYVCNGFNGPGNNDTVSSGSTSAGFTTCRQEAYTFATPPSTFGTPAATDSNEALQISSSIRLLKT